jgi:multiple sugar transport system substrate-binding protein
VAEEPAQDELSCSGIASGQTIEMWSPLTGPDGDEMTALAQRFSSENEFGITVNHVPQPEYVQKLNASAAANQLPAMTVVRVINVGELAERNVLQPFSDEVLALVGEDVASHFPDNVWTAGEYAGERYSIPLDIHPLVMYYNKELFAAAGVEEPGAEPWTREEFEAALEQLHSEDVSAIAIGTAFQAATLFQTYIQQFGGELTNEAGDTASFDSEAAVEAMAYVNELKQTYSPEISGAGDPEVAVFKQGNAAIVIHGPWHISDLQQLDYVGFAPVPQSGDQYAVWAGSHQLALTTEDPAQQAAAACWIGWLSENSVEWAKAGQVPARNEVRQSDELAEVAAPIAAVAPTADEAVILPQVPELEGALWGEFGPVVDAVLMGEESDIQSALEQAASRSQQIIDENQERYGG